VYNGETIEKFEVNTNLTEMYENISNDLTLKISAILSGVLTLCFEMV